MRQSILFFLLFIFAFSSFAQNKNDEFNFPPNFGKKSSGVLIPPCSSNRITRCIIEVFEKGYGGKSEGTETYALAVNSRMADFGYAFIITEHVNPGFYVGRERYPPSTDYKFGLLELSTGKIYSQDFWSGSYKKGAKNYVKHLEALRKMNGGL